MPDLGLNGRGDGTKVTIITRSSRCRYYISVGESGRCRYPLTGPLSYKSPASGGSAADNFPAKTLPRIKTGLRAPPGQPIRTICDLTRSEYSHAEKLLLFSSIRTM
ncbi:hypothetical protein EVAR_53395_1 [Eumeta japonica]|uniref:Uncharacterized protein n=1 Tax=Eumeta variegata TaxID=151549 RepID=A0A4C1Y9J4_EUMVA|nr:hypothetical protein EVAR_53395_1 [Eumeta japonica]